MPPQDTEMKQQVRQRFANVARSPKSEQVFPVGPDSAKALGYDGNEIDGLPAEVTESFSGVGNPLSLGDIENGQTVLDLVPKDAGNGNTIHVICEVTDSGSPPLTRYQRVVVELQ